jgi:signal peptidase I
VSPDGRSDSSNGTPTEANSAFLESPSGSSSVAGARRQQRIGQVRSMREWVVVLAGAIGVALLVRAFLLASFFIPSESMLPTLKIGDRVLVNKAAYRVHDVHRGDVVVFERPPGLTADENIKDLVKRVIGLPGDTVEFREDRVIVNGRLLDEPYLARDAVTRAKTLGPSIAVPPGTVLVLGDNREGSKDGRFFGPIRIDSIVGRAFVVYWPTSSLGFL